MKKSAPPDQRADGRRGSAPEIKPTGMALTESEKRFRSIFENSKEGIIFFDGKTQKILLANGTMAQLMGSSKEELTGRSISSLHPAEDWPAIEQEFRKHASGEISVSTGIPIIRNDGSVFYADIRSSLITLEGASYFSAFFQDITERKRFEDLLNEEQRQLKLVIDSAPIIIFYKDKEGKFIRVNKAFAERLDMPEEAFVGKTVFDLYDSHIAQGMTDDDLEVLQSRSSKLDIIEQYESADGLRWIQTDKIPIFDGQGEVAGLLGFAQDITGRKQAEEALTESEGRYRSLFENSADAILLTAPDGRIFRANPAACRMFGRTEDEIVKIGRNGIIDQNDPRLDAALHERDRTGRFRGELTLLRGDGRPFPGEVTSAVYLGEDGQPRTSMIIRDITDTVQIRAALRESEAKYRSIVETIEDGFYETDLAGRLTFFNEGLIRQLGYSRAELMGMGYRQYADGENAKIIFRVFNRVYRTGESSKGVRYDVITKAGEKKAIETSVVLIRDAAGNPVGFRGITRDITEIRQTEQALQKSEERFRIAAECTSDFVSECDIETGRFEWFGDAALRLMQLFGEIPETPEALDKFIHPEDRNRVRQAIRKHLRDGEKYLMEYRMVNQEGTTVHFRDAGMALRNSEGRAYKWIGTLTDITVSKQAAEALRTSEELFRLAAESTSDFVYECDLETGRFHWFGDAAPRLIQLLGEVPETARDFDRYTHPEDYELVRKAIRDHLREGEKYLVEYRATGAEGKPLHLRGAATTLRDSEGRAYRWIGTVTDITERKQAEEALRISEERFRLAAESSNDIICEIDGETGRYEWFGDAPKRLAQLLGEAPATVADFRRFIHPDDIDRVKKATSRHLSEGGQYREEYRVINTKGQILHFLGAGKGLYNDQGRAYRWIGTLSDITESKQAEAALQNSEERFRLAAESANDMIFEIDVRTSRYEWFGDAGERIMHLLGEIPGTVEAYGSFIHPEDRERVETAARQQRRAGGRYRQEYRLINKEGHILHVRSSGMVLYDRNGRAYRLVGTLSDITERKQAEEALRKSEERYRRLMDNASDAILIADMEGNLLEVNDRAEELLGYGQDELHGMNITQLHPQEDLGKAMDAFRKIAQGELNAVYDINIWRKDGRLIPVDIAGTMIELSGGKIVQGILRDITARKQADEALRQAEEKYRSIVENAVEGIFQSTPDGKFRMANTAVARYHGYDSSEEFIAAITDMGKQLFVPPIDAEAYNQALAGLGGVIKGFETQFRRKDGTTRWGSLNLRTVYDKEGHVLYYEGTVEDITARKEAMEKLHKAMGGIIQAMVMTVETRDPYTAGHQRRVAELARSIAQEMGLSADQADGLRMAGNVHDLGKISVPASILSKTSKLSDIEYKLVQVHPQIGYDILKDIDFPWPLAQIVLQHHERMNGSGYPQGLSGDDILPEARILAVADVVEAISSHRPYRPAFGVDLALEEIEKNRGILYDSAVVDVCLRLFREKGFHFT
ncbi:MAG: PAS domain S-box protein [Deltaproteobacteria bacterium]|nr:PAS domain S-box protein [Deltaproteobacteria bacterium]